MSSPPLRPPVTSSDSSSLFHALQINEGYESNLGEPLRKVAEDVRKEYLPLVEEWKQKEAQARKFGDEVSAQLKKEAAVSVSFTIIWSGDVSEEELRTPSSSSST